MNSWQDERMPHPAFLAISHGTGNPAGQAAIAGLAEAIADALPGVTTRLGHVDVQQPDVAVCLAELSPQPVVIVPLLLSAGYHVHVDLARAAAAHTDVAVAEALGPDPRLVDVLVQRLDEAGLEESDAVVVAVAGSSDERANAACREVAAQLAARIARPVNIGFLAAATPTVRDAVEAAREGAARVMVSSYLMAPGYFHDLTVREAHRTPGVIVTRPLLDSDAPSPALVALAIDRFGAVS